MSQSLILVVPARNYFLLRTFLGTRVV